MNHQPSPTFSNEPPASIITNTTHMTYEALWAFNRSVGKVRSRTVLWSIYTVIMLGYFVFYLILGVTQQGDFTPTTLIMFGIFFALGVFMLVFLRILAPRQVKKSEQLNGICEYTINERELVEDFTSPTTQSQTRMALSALLKVTETEDYIYLFIRPNAAYILSKVGFTMGSEAALKALLRSRLEPSKLKFK